MAAPLTAVRLRCVADPPGNRVGSRSAVRLGEHEHGSAPPLCGCSQSDSAAGQCGRCWMVLVECGRDARLLFYCSGSGLKGSTSTALLVSPPSSETCSGSVTAAVRSPVGAPGGWWCWVASLVAAYFILLYSVEIDRRQIPGLVTGVVGHSLFGGVALVFFFLFYYRSHIVLCPCARGISAFD
jgi:hypothetical protein